MKSRKRAAGALIVVLVLAGIGWADLSDGLVAHYPFNGNANDASGNGNDGTVYGATLTADRFGNPGEAYSFDGTGDYIRVPDSDELDLTSSFTLSFWICSASSRESLLLAKHRAFTDMDGSWALFRMADSDPQYSGLLFMHNWLSPSGNAVYSEATIQQESWVHWTITYDEPTTTTTFYIDGYVDVICDYTFNIQNTSLDLLIGAGEHFEVPVTYFYEGLMDEVRIYNRALSESEILQLAGLTIEACVDIDPDTLNLDSEGDWVTCYIELPEECDVADVDVDSVLLEGLLEVQQSDIQDGVLMVKFNREDLVAYLDLLLEVVPAEEMELVVTGNLMDGTPFEGSDTIRVIDEGGEQ